LASTGFVGVYIVENHLFILLISKCQSVILDLVELDSDVEVEKELKLPKVQNKFCM
jgi:hypothetical protein